MTPDSLRQDASQILQAALKAADPAWAVKQALRLQGGALTLDGRSLDLARFDRIVAVGAGKAGAPMAQALEEVLGDRLAGGLVVVKDGHGGATRKIRVIEASHPVPDERGVAAGQEIAAFLQANAGPRTLVICLLSGGGSALLVSPAPGLSLADKQETTRLLLACGADIAEINAIRKHLSQLKGGGLARLAGESQVASLIVSDVVGDRLDTIASGPTVPDQTTWADCREILTRHGVWQQTPEPVRRRIQEGLDGKLPDTPKPGQAQLAKVMNLIVAGNRQALDHAAATAGQLGYAPLILSSSIEGETCDIARMHAAMAREVRESGHPLPPPCCLISGGETTVTLNASPGKGGRNQEFALACALDLAGLAGVLALSAGTDGTDGPTDAAGAQADGDTVSRAKELGLEPRRFLAGHDAYNFFEPLGDLLITGPTRTNVMDIRLMLIGQ
ncbi:glycerate kinase [Desulfocarbo indianensis]|nr:glycerate kinase [Desulfocarbo indianensis]